MELRVDRYSDNGESTLGLLFLDGEFMCYTIEDEKRTEKVFGETRIPDGEYPVLLRTEGGFHQRYGARYPEMHKGMLHIQDVPNFEYILIHIGNDDDDTAGCLLVGNTANNNTIGNGFIGGSRDAYERLYPVVSSALEKNECVTIKYRSLYGKR